MQPHHHVRDSTKSNSRLGNLKKIMLKPKEIYRAHVSFWDFNRKIQLLMGASGLWPAAGRMHENEKITDFKRIFHLMFSIIPFFWRWKKKKNPKEKNQNKYFATSRPPAVIEFHYFYEFVNLLQFLFRVLKLPAKLLSEFFITTTSDTSADRMKMEKIIGAGIEGGRRFNIWRVKNSIEWKIERKFQKQLELGWIKNCLIKVYPCFANGAK